MCSNVPFDFTRSKGNKGQSRVWPWRLFPHVADRPRLLQRILRLWRRHEFGLTDSAGLYLEVSPNQSKRWFWKYYFDGKEMRLALGIYDEPGSTKVVFSLNAARGPRELLRTGVDPMQQRHLDKLTRQTRSGTTFEAVARELHATKLEAWSKQCGECWIERMEKDLFPWIGIPPLSAITAPLLLHALRRRGVRGRCRTCLRRPSSWSQRALRHGELLRSRRSERPLRRRSRSFALNPTRCERQLGLLEIPALKIACCRVPLLP